MTRKQRRSNLVAFALGLGATALVIALFATGRLDTLENLTYDLRVRYANPIEQDDRITLITIGDRDLRNYGRWPWPRDQQAALVSIPAELGAAAILVDLTWLEPEPARLLESARAANSGTLEVNSLSDLIEPDLVLAAALRDARIVYPAYHYYDRDLDHSPDLLRCVLALQNGDSSAAQSLARDLERRLNALSLDLRMAAAGVAVAEDARILDRARLIATLADQPMAGDATLREKLALPQRFIDLVYNACREAGLRLRFERWLEARPDAPGDPEALSRQFHRDLLGREMEGRSPFQDALRRAVREVLSTRSTRANAIAEFGVFGSAAPAVDRIEPVGFELARAAKRCCFANFLPDPDGTVRRLALLRAHEGHLLSQLGFTVAWDVLGLQSDDVTAEPGRLTLRRHDNKRPLVIQLDETGRALIPWISGSDWSRQFRQLPASALRDLQQQRDDFAHNERVARSLLLLALDRPEFPQWREAADLLKARDEAERQRLDAHLHGDTELIGFLEQQIAQVDQSSEQVERALRAWASKPAPATAPAPQTPPPGRNELAEFVNEVLAEIDRARDANVTIAAEIADKRQRLSDLLRGRVCLIGYTATSLADMKPIPTNRSAPGVLAHANILNGMLTGRMIYSLPAIANALLAAAAGLVATSLAVLRRPREAMVAVLGLALIYVALAGYLAFYYESLWVALTPAVGALLLAYAAIAAYRYIFVDSERRQLATALGQFTSPDLARQMAEDPELCQRAESREVSAMFTDLRGFTTISERIGAERTQRVLNVCLGRFTEALLRHEAMVNKFIGDGIFAFWNPVIRPQDDHAVRSCAAAFDLQRALAQLKEEQRGRDDVFEELLLRVGVATGNAVVGPCGSEQKFDYTCIGDSVNLASRLESANKFYGTRILVGGLARDRAGDGFVFRPLGGVQVKGKTEAVPVFELVGRSGEVPAERLDLLAHFARGVDHFQSRRWPEALECFLDCRRRDPSDLATERFIEVTRRYAEQPPPEGWNGAIELTEK